MEILNIKNKEGGLNMTNKIEFTASISKQTSKQFGVVRQAKSDLI